MSKATPSKISAHEINAITEKLKKSLLTISQSESNFFDFEEATVNAVGQTGRDFLELELHKRDVEAHAVEVEGKRFNKVGRNKKKINQQSG